MSFLNMRQPQVINEVIEVMFTAKHEYHTLNNNDLNYLRNLISENEVAGNFIDDSELQEGVWKCQSLEAFLWLIDVTFGHEVNSKQLKLSVVGRRENYTFFARVPAENIGSNFLTYHIPMWNEDLDTAKFHLIGKDASSILMQTDLLGAAILMHKQFRLSYKGIVFDLAMLCDED